MKYLIILFFILPMIAIAQPPTPPGMTKINARYDWLSGKMGSFTMPTGPTTPTTYSGPLLKGNQFWDSVGKKLRIYDGTYWRNYPDSVYKVAADSTLHVRYGTNDLTIGTFGGGGGGATVVQNFQTITALRGSNFYLTAGNLIAKMYGYNASGDGADFSFYWDAASSATDDGVYVVKPAAVGGAGRWLKVFNGIVRAKDAGIITDGTTDQTSALNTLFSNATLKHLKIDNGIVKITGKVDAKGKIISFENGASILGVAATNADTLTNFIVDADYQRKIFDTTLAVTNILNNPISIRWFGAVADDTLTVPGVDNIPFFIRAKATRTFPRIYFPAGAPLHGYRFSDSIIIDKQIEFFGDGVSSIIKANSSTKRGIKLKTSAANGCYLHDFAMTTNWGQTSNGFNNDTAHGIWVSTNGNRLENITIQNFDGDGIYIFGDVNIGTNANLNYISNISVGGCGRAGVHLQGGDANQCELRNLNCVQNGRFGVWEESFLGNTFSNNHCATNAVGHNFNKTVVTRSGVNYWCIQNNGPSTSIVEPTVTGGWQNYWVVYGGSPIFPQTWNNATDYKTGAGYYVNGGNQSGTFTNCYNEGDQINAITGANSNNIILGGTLGASAPTTPYLRSVQDVLTANGFQVEDPGTTTNMIMQGGTLDQIGFLADAGAFTFGFKWYQPLHSINIASQNSLGATHFFSSLTAGSTIGRSAITHGSIGTVDGLFLYNTDIPSFRLLGYRSVAPVSGEFAAGDIFLYGGTDTTIIEYRCTVSGTPGTWKTMRTGNLITTDGVQLYENLDASGQGAIDAEQYFHLTANGGAITGIANFFGSTSNPTIVASGYYEIEAFMFYVTTGTGAVTFTFTNSAAPTSQNIIWEMSPVAGITAPPGDAGMLQGQALNDATAAKTIVTGSLTAATHYAHVKFFIKNSTGTSFKIQATSGGTNLTPQIGSWWRCRRIAAGNVGTFVN